MIERKRGVEMLTQFQEKAQKAIVIAESIAFDLGHGSVGSEHLLLSLLKMKESSFSKIMRTYHIDDNMIYEDIIRLFGQKDLQPFYMEYSEVVKKVLDDAILMSEINKTNKVSLNMLSTALLQQNECVALELLNKYHVPIDEVKSGLTEEKSLLHELDNIHELVNINELVKKQNRVLIGRDEELYQLFSTLCKKEKNNALLIGKAGVGKTALVEKLSLCIEKKEVPLSLCSKIIYELNLSSIVAGTKYRGEFEEKFKRIIQKVIKAKDAILFIDEIHNLIGAGGAEGAIDASNILKPYLARKDLTIIGATTIEEYYKYFEKDQAMNRRFSVIKLNQNTKDETYDILKGMKEQYEQYHQIHISDQNLKDVIQLSDTYLIHKVFPDKAIDVLDLACVQAMFQKQKSLEIQNIQTVIENMTGINLQRPIAYQDLSATLQQDIIGQTEAIEALTLSMQSLSTYPHDMKPQGVYLFVGPSGVGKTQTVKMLAKILNRQLIKLDMSEYAEASSISKIIGSSPGYVGYDDSLALLQDIILKPNSILLLDEIEKAHPQVLHLFLQVFDEGILKDNHHREICFKDTLIFMTSNQGVVHKGLGFKKRNFSKETFHDGFSPEFLNRIDEVIHYHPLTKTSLELILLKQSPCTLSTSMIEHILYDYDCHLGARGLLSKMKKYLVTQDS